MFPSARCLAEKDARTKEDNKDDLDWLSLKSFKSDLSQETEQLSQRDDKSKLGSEPFSSEDTSETYNDHSGLTVYVGSEVSDNDHYKRKRKKEKHKKKKKKRSRLRTPDKEDQCEKTKKDRDYIVKGNKVFIEDIPGLQARDAYRIDKMSDINTWNYGCLYRGHIANYQDFVNEGIGSSWPYTVEMKERKKPKKSDLRRYCCKENLKVINQAPVEKVDVKNIQLDHGTERIDINSCDKYDKTGDIRERLMDPATMMYIQGRGVNNEEIRNKSYILNQQVAEYNKKTRDNPGDVHTWLEFIDFQGKLATEKTISEGCILEKKIAIIEKAIEANPGSIKLKMKYLDLCKETLSFEVLIEEMEQLIFLHPTNILLWKQYLLYHQSYVSKFTVSNVCKAYHTCFRKLMGYLDGKLHTHTPNPNLHSEVLDIFIQYCYLLRQVGQTEKAIASFQAQIEYNLFCPVSVHQDAVSLFESFWDSGVPRVAEQGAKGWNYWYHNKELIPEMSYHVTEICEDVEKKILESDDRKWKIWMNLELERQKCHWLPWKPGENETVEDCEDLDRLVLYDDITEILMTFPTSLHVNLVYSFLQFLGLTLDKCDQLDLPSCSIENLHDIVANSEITTITDYLGKSDLTQSLIGCCVDQMIEKFEGEENTDFTVIKMYHKFYQCQNESKKINKLRKFIKTILKEEQNRNNLTVWSAYCDILCKCGCHIEATSVIETALTLVSDNKLGKIMLYQMLTETYLGIGNKQVREIYHLEKAQNVLICFTEDKHSIQQADDITATSVLRSRKKLECLCENTMEELTNVTNIKNLSKKDLQYVCCKFKMLTLFEYSFGRHELDLATSVLEDAVNHLNQFLQVNKEEIDVVKNVISVMNNLLSYSIKLTKHHMSIKSTPLYTLRHTLDHAMKILPNKPQYLHEFVNTELKTYISGRLDRHFSHVIRSSVSEVPFIYGVYGILCRQTNIDNQFELANIERSVSSSGGLINRLRSYLEQALRITSISHCPLVWRLYMYSEIKYGDLTRARGIFYRALQSCPWSKALYLDAVSLFSGDRIEEILDLMMEKEIRLQIPYEEVDILMDKK